MNDFIYTSEFVFLILGIYTIGLAVIFMLVNRHNKCLTSKLTDLENNLVILCNEQDFLHYITLKKQYECIYYNDPKRAEKIKWLEENKYSRLSSMLSFDPTDFFQLWVKEDPTEDTTVFELFDD